LTLLFEVSGSDFSTRLEDYLTFMDFLVFIIYLIPIFLILFIIKRRNEDLNPAYKYFLSGFFIKILFALIFTFIYIFYYKGGDAIAYFWSTRAMSNLLITDIRPALDIIFFDNRTWENWSHFTAETTMPMGRYYFLQGDSFGVIRLSSFFMMGSFNLWLPCLLLLNLFWYRGIWKFFLLICKFYPGNMKWNAICILFIPSVLFWSSGIMKDSFTFACSLWIITNIYYCFIERKKFTNNLLMLIFNAFIIITLKPYIFVALIPATLVWVSFLYIKKIKNTVLKFIATPGLLAFGVAAGVVVLSLFSSKLGVYGDTDTMLKQAQVVQQDMIRSEEYGQNFYNIGYFEATPIGVLKKAPIAIIAGLYMPFLWQARSPVTLISGLENLAILIFTLFIIFRIGIKAVYKVIIKEPLIIFSFIFSIIFAFSVGLATANFGALVRYRILATPFFLLALINTFYLIRKEKKEQKSIAIQEK
jgi:hypothetical protein